MSTRSNNDRSPKTTNQLPDQSSNQTRTSPTQPNAFKKRVMSRTISHNLMKTWSTELKGRDRKNYNPGEHFSKTLTCLDYKSLTRVLLLHVYWLYKIILFFRGIRKTFEEELLMSTVLWTNDLWCKAVSCCFYYKKWWWLIPWWSGHFYVLSNDCRGQLCEVYFVDQMHPGRQSIYFPRTPQAKLTIRKFFFLQKQYCSNESILSRFKFSSCWRFSKIWITHPSL